MHGIIDLNDVFSMLGGLVATRGRVKNRACERPDRAGRRLALYLAPKLLPNIGRMQPKSEFNSHNIEFLKISQFGLK